MCWLSSTFLLLFSTESLAHIRFWDGQFFKIFILRWFHFIQKVELNAMRYSLVEIKPHPCWLPFNCNSQHLNIHSDLSTTPKSTKDPCWKRPSNELLFLFQLSWNLFAFAKRLKNAKPQYTYNPVPTGRKINLASMLTFCPWRGKLEIAVFIYNIQKHNVTWSIVWTQQMYLVNSLTRLVYVNQ